MKTAPKKRTAASPSFTSAHAVPGFPHDETPAANGIPAVVQRPSRRAPVHEREWAGDTAERAHDLSGRPAGGEHLTAPYRTALHHTREDTLFVFRTICERVLCLSATSCPALSSLPQTFRLLLLYVVFRPGPRVGLGASPVELRGVGWVRKGYRTTEQSGDEERRSVQQTIELLLADGERTPPPAAAARDSHCFPSHRKRFKVSAFLNHNMLYRTSSWLRVRDSVWRTLAVSDSEGPMSSPSNTCKAASQTEGKHVSNRSRKRQSANRLCTSARACVQHTKTKTPAILQIPGCGAFLPVSRKGLPPFCSVKCFFFVVKHGGYPSRRDDR